VPESRLLPTSEVAGRHPMPPPYVIKPNAEGSSVGIYIVREGANGPPALAPGLPDQVMVERYVPGRELTVTVMGDRALGCRGVTRTDFRWDETLGADGLFVLELNTQPGMTPTSLVPEQAAAEGLSFGALCRWIVEDASCDR
jgi:D-alanine-D-alanine ligase